MLLSNPLVRIRLRYEPTTNLIGLFSGVPPLVLLKGSLLGEGLTTEPAGELKSGHWH